MIDIKNIKKQLDTSLIIFLLENLGATWHKEQRDGSIIFESICHGSDSHKLYYYPNEDGGNFYCYSCCDAIGDIFSLVQMVNNCNFIESIKYVCNETGINTSEEVEKKYNFKNHLGKFIKKRKNESEIKIYDESYLDLFIPCVYEPWVEENITEETQEKFGIRYYKLRDSIIIPNRDIYGNLIGIRQRNLNPDLYNNKYMPVRTLNNSFEFPTSKSMFGIFENSGNIHSEKTAIIFESEKSCMMCESYLDKNISVAIYGMNLSDWHRNTLIGLGVENIVLAFDKPDDYDDKEKLKKYNMRISNTIEQFKGYCNVYVIEDKQDILPPKSSPTDLGKEIFLELYNNKTLK